ncbi:uncharacterized protein [Palaemon carinicauda]|uniref:uncharacterized protein n=1 Tax=Palaemon carinicauda TaxID=392227 RepID=UPI0035B5963C
MGACRSFLTWTLSRTQCRLSKPANVRLIAANKSAISNHGKKTLTLLFGSANNHWKFLTADVTLPILGADFLSHFHLLVDVAHRWLVNADFYWSTPLQSAHFDLAFHIKTPTNAYAYLFTSYPVVFHPELHQMPTVSAKNGIYTHVKMMGAPVFARFRRLTPDRLVEAKQMLNEIEKLGLWQKISSP